MGQSIVALNVARLREGGWAGLTAKESGRVGAAMRRPLQKQE